MGAQVVSGHVIDAILLVMVAEGVVLLWFRRRSGRGIAALDLLPTLAAGACLMLALRAALVGADPRWIALCLVGSLAAHVADLGRRWRRAAG